MQPKEKYTTPNLRNACRVLKRVADFPEGLELSRIGRDLDIPRTTAMRICITLELENLLARNSAGRYTLGSGLAPLGMRAFPNSGLREIAVPILADVVDITQETSHVAVLCGKDSLLLEVHDSPHALRVASRPGCLAMIHCSATGKIFLAHSIYVSIRKFLEGVTLQRRTPRTLTTLDELEAELVQVKRLGYAVDDEEYHLGVRCVAAPVRDAHDHVVAAVGITGATARFGADLIPEYSRVAMDAAARLSAALIERGTDIRELVEDHHGVGVAAPR